MPVKGGGSRKRSHKAKGVTEQGADRQLFHSAKEGRDMSVAEYYLVEYDCRQATGVSLQLRFRLCLVRNEL